MKIFITSDLLNCIKKDGKYIPTKINNDNGLVDQLKENLTGKKGIVFIASSKNDYPKTDSYSNVLFESLKLSGIDFENYFVIDNRTKDKTEEIIDKSNMVFLAGGDTLEEIEFFNKINLREILKNYGGVVMGQSAGSINLACDVYNSPERMEDLKKKSKWKGLGLTNISVEPHFVYSDADFTDDEKLQRKEVLKESYNRKLYGICDGSHIFIDEENYLICGESYKIKNGIITKICNKKETIFYKM